MCSVPRKVIFCSSLMLIWPGILPRYVSSPILIAPNAPMITGIVSVLMPHIRLVSISESLYLDSFSVTFTDLLLLLLLLLLLFIFSVKIPCSRVLQIKIKQSLIR